MKKWHDWLIMAAIFFLAGVANYFNKRTVIGNIIQVIIFIFLALSQFLCDKHSEKGKRIFKYIVIYLFVIIILIPATFIASKLYYK